MGLCCPHMPEDKFLHKEVSVDLGLFSYSLCIFQIMLPHFHYHKSVDVWAERLLSPW